MGCVWVYMEKVELCYWWEHSDEKALKAFSAFAFFSLLADFH